MALALGVDTGGTYTDAVLIRDEAVVVARAKALTTRHDLALGVGAAVRAVLAEAGVGPGDIGLAALSTTLATNALVEGQGGRVALILVGFRPTDPERPDLREALSGDPACVISGGHSHAGAEAAPLDIAALNAFLDTNSGFSGYAVAGLFATRNPAHEQAVAQIISERTGRPVTCSHQLSARLNGPKRAVTAVLNARLIGMIDRLIGRAGDVLHEIGISAPLMVVRGDGALMSAQQARIRPIETILSGPAASIVGARWLTGAQEAVVSDIGGTTTDIAVIRGGRPAIDPDGAQVGGHRTMVEAVAMRTTGLGGDSEVRMRAMGLAGGVTLGPRRVLPIALIAAQTGAEVLATLEAQLRNPVSGEPDARFARAVPGLEAERLSPREALLLERLGDTVLPLSRLLRTRMDQGALDRLVSRGLVQLAGVTPTDASHVLGQLDRWDGAAARVALELMARKRTGDGGQLADGAEPLARMIVDQLTEQTVLALLETAFAEEGESFSQTPADLARHVLLRKGLDGHRGLLALDARLNCDVIGLGASAACYYPAVGTRLRCTMVLPPHAGVANAIGAVVGRVTVRRSGTVTTPSEGRFRAHLETGPEDFPDPESALAHLEAALRSEAESAARAAGAQGVHVSVAQDIRTAQVEARAVFVEATLTVEASGRPRVATE